MRRWIGPLIMASLALSACGTKVKYDLSCNTVSCPNASRTSSFNASSGSTSFTCVWDCASYQGNTGVYVSLTFWNRDGCWSLDSEYIADGICN